MGLDKDGQWKVKGVSVCATYHPSPDVASLVVWLMIPRLCIRDHEIVNDEFYSLTDGA